MAHVERLRHLLNDELDQVTVQPFIDNLSFVDVAQLNMLPQSNIPNVVRMGYERERLLAGWDLARFT